MHNRQACLLLPDHQANPPGRLNPQADSFLPIFTSEFPVFRHLKLAESHRENTWQSGQRAKQRKWCLGVHANTAQLALCREPVGHPPKGGSIFPENDSTTLKWSSQKRLKCAWTNPKREMESEKKPNIYYLPAANLTFETKKTETEKARCVKAFAVPLGCFNQRLSCTLSIKRNWIVTARLSSTIA